MGLKLVLLAGSAVGLAATIAAPERAAAATASCESLTRQALPNARIDAVATVPANGFTPPAANNPAAGPPRPLETPAFCRVSLTLTPSAQSDIRSEVWLPLTGWNGKFMMVGNGAWGGTLPFAPMAAPLSRGYATAATDTGHRGGAGEFAAGKRDLWLDYGWRAVHETADKAKSLIAAYYGIGPAHAYWNGCSTGGKQALKTVQAFPADFDGVIGGAPANNWARLQTRSLWMSRINMPVGEKPVLSVADFALLHRAAVEQCDALDGVKDGEIGDPRRCDFKPASLACKPGQAAGQCLSPEQVAVATRIYGGPKRKDGSSLYPASPPGAEREMGRVSTQPWALGVDQYRYYATGGDPAWDFHALDPESDVVRVEAWDDGNNNAVDPDLSAFEKRGGKLIQYHGWADGLISPEGSINYYETVAARMGGLDHLRGFHRLFMVPNMSHCNGGYAVDWITALEDWVEHGRAPDQVLGARVVPVADAAPGAPPTTQGARPICAYPSVVRYKGSGAIDDPKSFTCAPGPRGVRPGQGPAKLGGAIAVLYPKR